MDIRFGGVRMGTVLRTLMVDILRECQRLCREREGTTIAGWKFASLQVTTSRAHPGYVLLDYRREPVAIMERFPLFIKVTCLYAVDELHGLLNDPRGLRQLIPAAELVEIARV